MTPPGRVRADPGEDVAAGPRVKAARRAAGLTQAALAKEVEVSRQTVISIETGDYAPSVYLAVKIARRLDTDVEALWG